MATKRVDAAQNIYQIKVTLLGTKPPIWRRLLVPASLTLNQLHNVLQIAMGWQNCHMHEFRIGRRYFGEPSPEEGLMGVTPTEDERKVCLPAVLGKVGAKMIYTYDMGIAGNTAWFLKNNSQSIPRSNTRLALMVSSPARRRTAAASPDTTTCWKPWPIPAIQNMKN
jgi:Plasmid pRiA4b ORF-3-like protein